MGIWFKYHNKHKSEFKPQYHQKKKNPPKTTTKTTYENITITFLTMQIPVTSANLNKRPMAICKMSQFTFKALILFLVIDTEFEKCKHNKMLRHLELRKSYSIYI
jgi:hypothetical protein